MSNQTTSPKLTILLPVYNAGTFLAEAIDSILQQTFKNFELLIINDGSSDESLSIINKFASKDSRVRVISRENKGFIATLQEGIAIAKSDLIARMDADDIALPTRLEKQYAYMSNHPECMVVGCQLQIIDETGKKLHIDPRPTTNMNLRLFLAYGCALSGPTVIFRKAILESVGGFDKNELPAEDYACWVKLAEKYPDNTLINLPEVLYLYRETSTGISLSNKNIQIQKTIDIGRAYRLSMIKRGWKFLSKDIHKGWISDIDHITDYEAREQLIRIYFTIQTWFRHDVSNIFIRYLLKARLINLTKRYNPNNTPYIYNQPNQHTFPED